jgi:hypothetical protein
MPPIPKAKQCTISSHYVSTYDFNHLHRLKYQDGGGCVCVEKMYQEQ